MQSKYYQTVGIETFRQSTINTTVTLNTHSVDICFVDSML